MIGVDAGSGDRMTLGVLAQYRMATTEQMHRVIAPEVRIEQTRRRLARLRTEGLVDRITLPQAGRTRVWFPTSYGVQLACGWPELHGRRPSRTVSDPTAVRLASLVPQARPSASGTSNPSVPAPHRHALPQTQAARPSAPPHTNDH
ncbi:replication-relaxation family protein [Streptomyces sp. NPDC007971]|uniref:replication-relaxation family protein n=1 Tax=Streptomyces sp. NPDC007971 TaxID=3364799 RepID=UPI0036E9D4B1